VFVVLHLQPAPGWHLARGLKHAGTSSAAGRKPKVGRVWPPAAPGPAVSAAFRCGPRPVRGAVSQRANQNLMKALWTKLPPGDLHGEFLAARERPMDPPAVPKPYPRLVVRRGPASPALAAAPGCPDGPTAFFWAGSLTTRAKFFRPTGADRPARALRRGGPGPPTHRSLPRIAKTSVLQSASTTEHRRGGEND